jgi:[histone H3]-lysine9 N-trimethyltransferase EHMT
MLYCAVLCCACAVDSYNASGRLLCADMRQVITECHPDRCRCSRALAAAAREDAKTGGTAAVSALANVCRNRTVQSQPPVGIGLELELFRTARVGWGVRTLSRIPKYVFVCEYVGELITEEIAQSRGARYDAIGCSYLWTPHLDPTATMSLTARKQLEPFTIDANYYGNVARFINHSCAPNLVAVQVQAQSRDGRMPRIAFFSTTTIQPFTELTIDYHYEPDADGRHVACQCGAPTCRGLLR